MIKTIHECMLFQFITCLCDNDLSVLGEGSQEELEAAWSKIYEQYTDGILDAKGKYIFSLVMEINVLQYKRAVANAIVTYLSAQYDQKIAQKMIDIGAVDFIYPEDDEKKMVLWYKKVKSRIKNLISLEQSKSEELKRIQPDADGQNISRDYFDEMLTVLSTHFKFNVNEREITVSRYISMVKQFRKANKPKK